MSAYHLYKKTGISGEKSNETVHHGRNVSEGTRKISFFLFFFFFLRAQLNPTPILGAKTIPVIFVEKSFTEISSQMHKAIRRLKDISAKESRSY